MKTKKEEISQEETEKLFQKLLVLKTEKVALRFQRESGKLPEVNAYKKKRIEIARLLTILRKLFPLAEIEKHLFHLKKNLKVKFKNEKK